MIRSQTFLAKLGLIQKGGGSIIKLPEPPWVRACGNIIDAVYSMETIIFVIESASITHSIHAELFANLKLLPPFYNGDPGENA